MLVLIALLATLEEPMISCQSTAAVGMCTAGARHEFDAIAKPNPFQFGTHAATRYEVGAIGVPAFPSGREPKSGARAHVDSTYVPRGDSDLLGEDAGLKALAFSGVVSAGAGLWVLGMGAPVGEPSPLSQPASSSGESAVLGSVLVVAGAAALTTALGLIALDDEQDQEPR